MKNLFKFVCVLSLLFVSFAFGQSKTGKTGTGPGNTQQIFDETTRNELATNTAQLKDNVAAIYQANMTYDAFRAKLLGTNNAAATSEGEALMTVVYNYLKNGTSSETIISNYDGLEMAQALVKSNGNDAALFATPDNQSHIFTPAMHTASKDGGCKWYQIGCWVDSIFGAGTMDKIIAAAIPILIKKL